MHRLRQVELKTTDTVVVAPAVERVEQRGFGRLTLPAGHTWDKSHKEYEEVFIPAKTQAHAVDGARIPVTQFPAWARPAFGTIRSLNRLQSELYETAFHSSENMLVCAPTYVCLICVIFCSMSYSGAGKTNVALMTILREIGRHMIDGEVDADAFKIIYVAPMKALAAEMVCSSSLFNRSSAHSRLSGAFFRPTFGSTRC